MSSGVKQGAKQAIFWFSASISRKRYEMRPKSLLMTNGIGTKIDDLGWPCSNFLGISRDFAHLGLGGNNG